LDSLVLIVKAYHSKITEQKSSALQEANLKLETLKILFRLAKDVQALEPIWYQRFEKQLQETGKMLGGWMASIKANR